MNKTKRDESTQLSILDLLPQERRQEVIAEALSGQVIELLKSNPDATLGGFIEALTEHEYWESMKQMKVSLALAPRQETVADQHATPTRRRASWLQEDVVSRVLTYIQKNAGQRSEEIQAGLVNEDAGDVARALAKLRKEKRVTTQGARRAMTYSAA